MYDMYQPGSFATSSDVRRSNERADIFYDLCTPSATSIIVSSFLCLGIFYYGGQAINNQDDLWFLNILTGGNGNEQFSNLYANFESFSQFLSNNTVNNLLVFVFWVLVGLGIYEILQNVLSIIYELQEDKDLIVYDNPGSIHHTPTLIKVSLQRMLIRTACMFLLIGYIVFCFGFLWPAIISVFISRAFYIQSPVDVALIICSFMGCIFSVHLITVLLRLLSLRSRVF